MDEHKTRLIDVHAHILPKVDDGSRYYGETRSMLKEAYQQGICKIIATPHYIHKHNKMKAPQILETVEKVRTLAKEIAPDLEIYPGEELFYYDGIVDALSAGRALTLAGTRYILVEFSTSIPYSDVFQAVRRMTLARYLPVLAHIERYQCLRRSGCVEELIQMGAYMQMNYSSLSGMRHLADRTWCRKMVQDGKIHLLGTDMHRLDHRPPDITKAVEWIEKKAGQECLERLACYHPSKLLAGEPL